MTIRRKEKKRERRGIYNEGKENYLALFLTHGANFDDMCHSVRYGIEAIF